MAAPTAPTLSSIVTEALAKAGYPIPSAALTTRASNQWMEEIKDDLLMALKTSRIKSIEFSSVMVTTPGIGKYSDPEESSDLSMTLLNGTVTGTAQAGSANTIQLEASTAKTEAELLGKEILVTSGTGKGSISQVIDFDESTKIATVSPNFNTAPASGSGYMVIESYSPIEKKTTIEYDRLITPTVTGKPEFYFPVGDDTYGSFYLYHVPDKDYGIRQKWYADLTRLDLSGTRISTLYRRWRNVWIYGVAWKAIEAIPDPQRASIAKGEYEKQKMFIIGRENYGHDISSLQCVVQGW